MRYSPFLDATYKNGKIKISASSLINLLETYKECSDCAREVIKEAITYLEKGDK